MQANHAVNRRQTRSLSLLAGAALCATVGYIEHMGLTPITLGCWDAKSTAKYNTMLKSIWREKLDNNRIQVLPLAVSSRFMFTEYVYNFLRDGLLVMRIDDISRAETTLTDQFQYPHLQTGIGTVPDLKCDLSSIASWAQLLSQIPQGIPVCIEEEDDGLLYMGLIYQPRDDRVEIHEFLGSGRWRDEITTVYYDDLTCLQAGNGYLTMYEQTLDPAPQQVALRDAASRRPLA